MKKRYKSWTILLMSESNRPIIQLKIPKIFPFITATIFSVLFIWLFIAESSARHLKDVNQTLQKDLKQAQRLVEQQQSQISYYEQEASQIEEKLAQLDQLEQELMEMLSSLDPGHIESETVSGAMGGLDIPVHEEKQLDTLAHTSTVAGNEQALIEQLSQLEHQLPDYIQRYENAIENIEKINEKLKYVPTFWPADTSRITSTFGKRSDPFTGRESIHSGIDLAGPWGTPIYAAADGQVVFSGWDGGYGKSIVIHHNSTYKTRYGHMSQLTVKEGKKVKKGELIGYMGSTGRSTGSHLHFEVLKNGRSVDPYPYMTFLSRVLGQNLNKEGE